MRITNASDCKIFVGLTKILDKNIPTNQEIPIGSTKFYSTDTGTINLFIWKSGDLIWRGIVPTLIKNPLIFSKKGVMYGNRKIPNLQKRKQNWLVWVLFLLIIVVVIGIYLIK